MAAADTYVSMAFSGNSVSPEAAETFAKEISRQQDLEARLFLI